MMRKVVNLLAQWDDTYELGIRNVPTLWYVKMRRGEGLRVFFARVSMLKTARLSHMVRVDGYVSTRYKEMAVDIIPTAVYH